MSTSKRFVTKNGLDNNGNSISNLGVTGSSLTQVGAFPLTLTTTGATDITFPTSGTLATTSGTVTTATNIAGGTANAIPYQTGAGATTFLAQGTGVLQESAGAPIWTTTPTLTGTNFSGTAASLTAGNATKLATTRTLAITGDLSWTSPAFDGSANVTAAGTLATVNSNVGSFGSSTAIPTFTVNGKGLITAASTAAVIAPAGTLTGSTLAAGVTASSLTSVGTLGSLISSGTIESTAGQGFLLVNDGGYIAFYNTANTTRTGYIQGNTGANFTFAAENGASLYFNVAGTTRMNINPSGVIADQNGLELGYKDVPINAQSTAYVLAIGDRGKQVLITTGGVTVPASVFSPGNVISVVNNSGTAQTITQGASVTMTQAGTTNTGNRTLAVWGIATILCIASNTFIVSGNIT